MANDEKQETLDEVSSANARRREGDRQRRQRILDAIRSILSREDGRLVLSVILGISGFEIENAALGEACVRNEGARGVGLRVVGLLKEADIEGYLKLYREMLNA